LPQSTELKTSTSLFQSENEVSPCFELKYNFLERYKKPLTIPSTDRKRQNHNGLDKKTAEALKRRKSARQSSAAEEAPVPIVTYVEDEINGSFQGERYLTNYKEKHSYSTAFILSI